MSSFLILCSSLVQDALFYYDMLRDKSFYSRIFDFIKIAMKWLSQGKGTTCFQGNKYFLSDFFCQRGRGEYLKFLDEVFISWEICTEGRIFFWEFLLTITKAFKCLNHLVHFCLKGKTKKAETQELKQFLVIRKLNEKSFFTFFTDFSNKDFSNTSHCYDNVWWYRCSPGNHLHQLK